MPASKREFSLFYPVKKIMIDMGDYFTYQYLGTSHRKQHVGNVFRSRSRSEYRFGVAAVRGLGVFPSDSGHRVAGQQSEWGAGRSLEWSARAEFRGEACG
jgi:hypothetical protein